MSIWATIDIGTNSVRLLIAQTEAGQIKPLYRKTVSARLGEGMKKTILPQAGDRVINTLKEYKLITEEYEINNFRLAGTQFLREADNTEEFKARVLREVSWQLEVLSGIQEASLSYLGATRNLPMQSPAAVLDIGAGSTEIMLSSDMGVSMPIGSLRLFEQPKTAVELQSFVKPYLQPLIFPKDSVLIGVGGICTTLGAIHLNMDVYDPDKVSGLLMTKTEVENIESRLLALTPTERLGLPGIIPGREDIMPAGVQILLAVMTFLNFREFIVQDADLLFGMIEINRP